MTFSSQPRLYKSPGNGYKYAGTTDLECIMLVHPDSSVERKTTIDFKSGSPLKGEAKKKGYNEWPLQTSAYRNASDTNGNGVVHLNKETGEMTWFDYSDSYEEDLYAFIFLCEYWRNRNKEFLDKGLPSPTEILKVLNKPALVWWSVNCYRDYLYQVVDGAKEYNKELLYKWIEEGRKSFIKAQDKATDIGTLLHDYIRNWYVNKTEPPSTVPDEITRGFVAFLEWTDMYKVEPLATEKVVYGSY